MVVGGETPAYQLFNVDDPSYHLLDVERDAENHGAGTTGELSQDRCVSIRRELESFSRSRTLGGASDHKSLGTAEFKVLSSQSDSIV